MSFKVQINKGEVMDNDDIRVENHYWYTTVLLKALFGTKDFATLYDRVENEFRYLRGFNDPNKVQTLIENKFEDFVNELLKEGIL